MTLPGDIEHVPTKVVPFFVTGYDELAVEDEAQQQTDDVPEPVEERVERSSLVGQIALCLALATIGVHIAAVVVASSGSFVAGTVLAWIAIGLSVATVLTGLVAVIGRFGRGWAIAAIVLGIAANPFVLLSILNLVGGS